MNLSFAEELVRVVIPKPEADNGCDTPSPKPTMARGVARLPCQKGHLRREYQPRVHCLSLNQVVRHRCPLSSIAEQSVLRLADSCSVIACRNIRPMRY